MSSNTVNELISGLELKMIKTEDLQILAEVIDSAVCNNSSVFSMLLNNNVSLNISDIKESDNEKFLTDILNSQVSAEINFEAGIIGGNTFVFSKTLVADFSNIVMGAEKSEETDIKLGELQLSAFSEIINQFSSKLITALTSALDTKIGALSPAIKQQKTKNIELPSSIAGKQTLVITYDVAYSDKKDKVYQIIPVELALDIIDKFKESKIPEYRAEKMRENEASKLNSPNSTYPNNSSVTVQPVKFSPFDNSSSVSGEGKNLDLLMDIKLKLTVELGRTEMPIKKVLELSRGSVIELDKIAGEPVELYANGKLIANGEVVVIEDNFGLKITNIISPDNRLKNI